MPFLKSPEAAYKPFSIWNSVSSERSRKCASPELTCACQCLNFHFPRSHTLERSQSAGFIVHAGGKGLGAANGEMPLFLLTQVTTFPSSNWVTLPPAGPPSSLVRCGIVCHRGKPTDPGSNCGSITVLQDQWQVTSSI